MYEESGGYVEGLNCFLYAHCKLDLVLCNAFGTRVPFWPSNSKKMSSIVNWNILATDLLI
jgi:hypothetical protein